jgi:GntR family transcriptional regulator/MocR family aminotransferase
LLKIATLSDFLLQRIDRDGGQPLNRQLYQVIRAAILAEVLPAGLQLPSSRDLARELAISRNTVISAYDHLASEGYIATRTGAGTFVTDTVPDQWSDADRAEAAPAQADGRTGHVGHAGLSARGARLVGRAGASKTQWGAFMPGVPDVTRFPVKVWSRLQNVHWQRGKPELLSYASGAGYLPLRTAIADYLRVARSVNCDPGQVIITAGIHQSIDLAAKLLGESGDRAWVEDPCYWGTHSVLNSLDLAPVPVPVDAEGITLPPDTLRTPPRFIFVTPSHQYPLGPVMSLARRRALLDYAAKHQVWIMEDDYDSEFRYTGRPLASLQGMDTFQRVVYLGSFSKTLFPGLRIGFMVVPEPLADAFATGVAELYRGGQVFTQAVLADFMTQGYFASHIRRMRQLYGQRRQLLQQAIDGSFQGKLATTGGDAGLHLTLMLPDGCDDQAISREAALEGVIARPLSGYYNDPQQAARGLLLGYACVPDELIEPTFAKLAAVIARYTGG